MKHHLQKILMQGINQFFSISWQRDGEKMDTMTDFNFFDSKITADSDCNH